jgi:hypothetical protein
MHAQIAYVTAGASRTTAYIRLLYNIVIIQSVATDGISIEEWCILGCYAVWLL